VIAEIGSQLVQVVANQLDNLHRFARRHLGVTESGNRRGVFARAWPIGATALWIAILLQSTVRSSVPDRL